MAEKFVGPQPDRTFDGILYRWVPSKQEYWPAEDEYGQTLLGDRYVYVPPKAPQPPKINVERVNPPGNTAVKIARPLITGAGMTMGAAFGGPAAPATGIVAGLGTDLLQQYLTEKLGYEVEPSMTGRLTGISEPGTSKDAVIGAAENVGLPLAVDKLLRMVRGLFTAAKARNVIQSAPLPGTPLTPPWKDPDLADIPFTFSMYSGGRAAPTAIEKFSGKAYENAVEDANKALFEKAANLASAEVGLPVTGAFPTVDTLAAMYKGGVNSQFFRVANAMTRAKDNLISLGTNRANSAWPAGIQISGRINPAQSVTAAESFLNKFASIYSHPKSISPVGHLEKELNNAVELATKITNAKGGAISIQNALDLEESLKRIANWSNPTELAKHGNLQKIAQDFHSSLTGDIRSSLRQWGANNIDALDAFDEYTGNRRLIENLYEGKSPIRNIIGDPSPEDKKIFEASLESLNTMNLYARAGNSMKELKAYALKKVFEDSFENGAFNPDKMRSIWLGSEKRDIFDHLFSRTQYGSVGHLIDKMINSAGVINASPTVGGKKLLQFTKFGLYMLAAGGGLGQWATNLPWAAGALTYGAAGSGLVFTWDQLAKRVLLDPVKARRLAEAINGSGQVQAAVARMLMSSLKGAEAWITDEQGNPTQKIKVGGQPPESSKP